MHLRIIAAILCLALVLVQAGDYGPGKSIIYRHIQPSRVIVIHHHHGGRGGGSSSSSKSSKKSKSKGSGSNSSGKKRKHKYRYRRAAEELGGGSSGSRSSLED